MRLFTRLEIIISMQMPSVNPPPAGTAGQERAGGKTETPLLPRVTLFIQHGWPMHELDSVFQPYSAQKTELSVQDGGILVGVPCGGML